MKKLKYFLYRYFVQAMSAMALGLFSSLIIGLIIGQIAKIPGLEILTQISSFFAASQPVTGCAIGVAIAWGLKAKPLVIFSCAGVGAVGYMLGGPVGAFVAGVVGAELGQLVAGKTPVDIIVTPLVTIITGGLIAIAVGGPIQGFMTFLGNVINDATNLHPLPMGIVVSVIVGLALTAPISSAALCIMLGLDGLAAGAAVVGCCAQMVGFAVMSVKDNGWGSLLSVGIGTSMLQFGNIMKRPMIWIPPTLASAVLGPISTCVFHMTNIPSGAGMGTSGIVGQIGAFISMGETMDVLPLLGLVLLMHVALPALLTILFTIPLKKIGWIRPGDLKLQEIV